MYLDSFSKVRTDVRIRRPYPHPPCQQDACTGQNPLAADVFYGRPLTQTDLFLFLIPQLYIDRMRMLMAV